jgi:general secretion pathway protein J
MRTAKPKQSHGFTLLEILVALIIFGLMSVLAYRGLTSVLQSRDHLAQENRKWRAVSMLFARIEQDLNQLANRPVRDANNLNAAPFVAQPQVRSEHEAMLAFTRVGYPDQANALAGPLRSGYRLRGDMVEQLLWPAPDAAPRAVPAANGLLDKVAILEFQYLDASGAWHAQWPLPGNKDVFPAAVQVVLELKSGERIVRLFALPRLE